MFDKFVNFFFGPEEEDELEEFEETEEIKETIVEPVKNIQEEVVKNEKIVEEISNVSEEKVQKKKIDIKADGPESSTKETRVMKKPVRMARKEEYELQPVISPYHGVKGEVKKNNQQEVNVNASYSAENKRTSFNQVISPIYGAKKTKPILESVTVKKEEAIVPFVVNEEIESLEEEENLALDELISNNGNNDDDMIQFSLFGDDKTISDNIFVNEEVEDDLPF